MRRPGLDELVGDIDPAERERLERVHELLMAAGPPPELPPQLADAPEALRPTVIPFPRRYRFSALGAAAVLALALLGAGYAIGRGMGPQASFTVQMTGQGNAAAELIVFDKDTAGNWPMELEVHGLPPLDRNRRYELWLTKAGELVEPCGTFAVSATETTVPLNAPYVLRDYDGWVVVVQGSTTPVLRTAEV